MKNIIRIGAFADWRSQPIPPLVQRFKEADLDLVLYGGDDVVRFNREEQTFFEEIASHTRYGLGGVIGNDCGAADKSILSGEKVFDLHDSPLVLDNLAVLGLEGAPRDIGTILYEEEDALAHLEKQWHYIEQYDCRTKILVSHAPPKRILDFSFRFGQGHIGSEAVTSFIKEREIDLVICGHSHYNGGKHRVVGKTTVVNIASHDGGYDPGRLAWLSIGSNGKIFIEAYEELTTPVEWADLLKLPQTGPNRAKQMAEVNIKTLDDITKKNIPVLMKLPGVYDWHVKMWLASVESFRTKIAYRAVYPEWKLLENNPCLCYDIETDSLGNPWCVAITSQESTGVDQFFESDDELKLIGDFFEHIVKYPEHTLVSFSNSRHDRNCLVRAAKKHEIDVPETLTNEIDLGILVINRTIGLPTTDLKTLATHFGFTWTHTDLTGRIVGEMVSRYRNVGEIPEWDRLLEYNQDDALATKLVLEEVMKLDEKKL